MAREYVFTSESVTEGHPDKLCDCVSDAILDAHLEQDPESRVAVEAVAKTGFIVVAGEITSKARVDIPKLVRQTVQEIGYRSTREGFDGEGCGVLVALDGQSSEIDLGVKTGGAGDQGMMFGYACDETPELMPAPISYAHQLTRRLAELRKSGTLSWLLPDGKAQVAVDYSGDNKPVRFSSVVVSTQHEDIDGERLRKEIEEHVIRAVLPASMLDGDTRFHINPTGSFTKGGPAVDTGLTGRKIIVDTYGGMGRHGGGAFSGKDPTKVDRSAAYMMRYIAKNIVAAKLASRCELQVAYAIGVDEPVSVHVETFGTGTVSDTAIEKAVRQAFDLTPKGIIETLDLRRPIYRKTAAYGHFGRNEPEFTWERTDKVDELQKAVKAAA